MASISPYVTFQGKAEEAFVFYKSVFGGEFLGIHRFKDMPEGSKMTADEQNLVMHISLPIGNGVLLMGCDAPPSMLENQTVGNNINLFVGTDSENEATTIFKGLSSGGKISMPLADTFWGSYFGMCTDKFGIHWMVSFERPAK